MTGSNKIVLDEVLKIVAAADGELAGKTRLQKTAFMLELAGLGCGLSFSYWRFGPFSEDLAATVEIAPLLADLKEEQQRSNWGGAYSVFRTNVAYEGQADDAYRSIVLIAKSANPVVLELAATAAYLGDTGEDDPWSETARRKPEKAQADRLADAKALYAAIKQIPTPRKLPDL